MMKRIIKGKSKKCIENIDFPLIIVNLLGLINEFAFFKNYFVIHCHLDKLNSILYKNKCLFILSFSNKN